MIEEAINYPRNGDDALRTILIGGVLGVLSFLLLPGIVVSGYLLSVLRRSMEGDETPPAFEDWGDLLVDGVKAAIVGVAYFLLPTVVFTVAVGGAVVSAVLGGDVSVAAILGSLLGVLVSGVLWLAAWYVLPAALSNLAREGQMGAAFAFGDLRPILFDGDYATGWLVALVLVLVAGVVAGALNAVPLLGFVAGAFVLFYASVSAFYVYGRAVDAARASRGASESPTGRPAA